MRKPARWYAEEPDVPPGYEFYLTAFWDLTTHRQIGEAVGFIPVNEVTDYAEKAGLESATIRIFRTVIRAMDRGYVSYVADERKKQQEQNAPKRRR